MNRRLVTAALAIVLAAFALGGCSYTFRSAHCDDGYGHHGGRHHHGGHHYYGGRHGRH